MAYSFSSRSLQSNRVASLLDHSAEAAQRESYAQIDPSLTTTEQFRGMAVVSSVLHFVLPPYLELGKGQFVAAG